MREIERQRREKGGRGTEEGRRERERERVIKKSARECDSGGLRSVFVYVRERESQREGGLEAQRESE